MLAGDIDAIVEGRHGDAFRILGPHAVPRDWQSDTWEIRIFHPFASQVEVVAGDVWIPASKVRPEGFFVACVDRNPGRYRLSITIDDGDPRFAEDPYRFAPVLGSLPLHLNAEGNLFDAHESLGAHHRVVDGIDGVNFAVWAPNAEVVSVAGDFNRWDDRAHPMRARDGGVWEIFIPGLSNGAVYKYCIRSKADGSKMLRADPFAFAAEVPPLTGSKVWDTTQYRWEDAQWMESRAATDWQAAPISVYEVHLGSWLRAEGHRFLTYRELADKLVGYVSGMCYTHIELMPVLEHPFGGSWGYQVTGYFAPTSRFGSPDDFMYFVDRCHQAGIGVLLDWVPAHFPRDSWALARFDGTCLYEHEDPRQGEHRDWGTLIFNYGRNEVRSFLISSAMFWLKTYHIDGLRVDAVASMLYLDYSREQGDWIPNAYGGRENLEAIDFIKRFNEVVHTVPGAVSIAEESTSFPGVTRPVYAGGLGFTFKWNMGWMHDMFKYFKQDPVYRKHYHENLTFSMLYAFSEHYMLPISHDEVVHGKASLIGKMVGDEWQRFANARALLSYMYGHPGKKLLFMGAEIGQYEEWSEETSIRWDLLQYDLHRRLQDLVRALNELYRAEPAMHEIDSHFSGFEWIDFRDVESSVISFLRWPRDRRRFLVVVCNFTPVVRYHYRIGVPEEGYYDEILNSDLAEFGGSNVGNYGGVRSEPVADHARPASILITLPPLAVVVFRRRVPDS
jgi:1,4-alpha-glucan branching enzyme